MGEYDHDRSVIGVQVEGYVMGEYNDNGRVIGVQV